MNIFFLLFLLRGRRGSPKQYLRSIACQKSKGKKPYNEELDWVSKQCNKGDILM
jgi:hypothetical protein